jgi:hypothetical protein
MPATDFFDLQSYRSLSDPVPMSIASTAGHVTIHRRASDSRNAVLELDRQASDSLVGLRLRFRADKDYTKALIALGHYELGIAPKEFDYSPPLPSEQLRTLATSLEAKQFHTITKQHMDELLPRPAADADAAATVGRIQKYCNEHLGRLLVARFQHLHPAATFTAVDANEFEIYLFSGDELAQDGTNPDALKWGDINVKQNVGASNTTCEIVFHFVWFKIVLISAFDIFLYQKAYVGPGQTGAAEIWTTAIIDNTKDGHEDPVTGPPPVPRTGGSRSALQDYYSIDPTNVNACFVLLGKRFAPDSVVYFWEVRNVRDGGSIGPASVTWRLRAHRGQLGRSMPLAGIWTAAAPVGLLDAVLADVGAQALPPGTRSDTMCKGQSLASVVARFDNDDVPVAAWGMEQICALAFHMSLHVFRPAAEAAAAGSLSERQRSQAVDGVRRLGLLLLNWADAVPTGADAAADAVPVGAVSQHSGEDAMRDLRTMLDPDVSNLLDGVKEGTRAVKWTRQLRDAILKVPTDQRKPGFLMAANMVEGLHAALEFGRGGVPDNMGPRHHTFISHLFSGVTKPIEPTIAQGQVAADAKITPGREENGKAQYYAKHHGRRWNHLMAASVGAYFPAR